MPDFKSISFKMAVLQGGRQNLPPPVCAIQKTPCGIRLKAPFSTQVTLFYLKIPLEDQYSLKASFSIQMHFYPKISSKHQRSAGKHLSRKEQKVGANVFCPPNMSLTRSLCRKVKPSKSHIMLKQLRWHKINVG